MFPSPLQFLALVLAAAFCGPGVGVSGERRATSETVRGVVEVFTSQGCADCVPAEAVIRDLRRDADLVVVAYHVDYWDYIGWRDTLGSNRNGERQRDYARQLKSGSLATPQAVVNGSVALPGGDGPALRRALEANDLRTAAADRPRVDLVTDGETLTLRAEPGAAAPAGRAPVVMLVTYAAQTVTRVEEGENRGREMVDSQAVRDWRVVGSLKDEPLEVSVPLAMLFEARQGVGCAVLVQSVDEKDQPSTILAAAVLDF
ncbi:DUF1223 domain-containing protein [Aureimonas sp. AU4]|uniref:DUF1223 domain-containing protein n=1 Tax=Aureimonas sp. AU4 TaxID=1638163 RepID=UPI00078641EE|nr:DUF1223 domain-containing protein [Aureimonas sp. AU4]